MQLHVARLCLDCQEVHAAAQCPACTSASFVPLSKWVPAQERRIRPRPDDETADAFKRLLNGKSADARSKWPVRSAAIVATLGIGAWLWRRTTRSDPESKPRAGTP